MCVRPRSFGEVTGKPNGLSGFKESGRNSRNLGARSLICHDRKSAKPQPAIPAAFCPSKSSSSVALCCETVLLALGESVAKLGSTGATRCR